MYDSISSLTRYASNVFLISHTDGPNEFFSNNWVYEGLVAYGQGGQILPSLASKWTVTPNDIGGDNYVFTLREGVTFHDGTSIFACLASFPLSVLSRLNLVNLHTLQARPGTVTQPK